jgi:hypothetical protein
MPLSLRWGSVTTVDERLEELVRIEVDGRPCLAYPRLTGPVEPGDIVLVNAPGDAAPGAPEVVYANLTRGIGLAAGDEPDGLALPGTPWQVPIELGEAALDGDGELAGLPVLCCSRHSQVAPVCAGLGGAAAVYVQLGGGAPAAPLSGAVSALRGRSAVTSVVAVSPCLDGDVRCLTPAGALLWVRASGAAAAVCAPGPLLEDRASAATSWANASAAASAAAAAAALGGRPVLVPVVAPGAALAPETREALALSPGRTVVAWPVGLAPPDGVDVVAVDVEGWDVACVGLPLENEGKGPDEEPWFFRAAFAAGRVVDWGLV